jgi:hypothetical protein
MIDPEETQARAELLATMQQANATGDLTLLAAAAQLLTHLINLECYEKTRNCRLAIVFDGN